MPKRIAWHELKRARTQTAWRRRGDDSRTRRGSGRHSARRAIVWQPPCRLLGPRHGVWIDFLIGGDLLPLIAGVLAGRP